MVAFLRIHPVIPLFGDSITQFSYGEANVQVGWASLLSSAYQRRADILNRGFFGYTTQDALEILPRVFGHHPEGILFCTLFFGANDACLPEEPEHVPLEQYKENLAKIIIGIRERTRGDDNQGGADADNANSAFPIFIMTPPPVDEEAWRLEEKKDYYSRTNERARLYGQAAKEIAKDFDHCHVLDTWELLGGDTKTYGKHLCDGLHLSDSGNRLIFDGLFALIKKVYPHLAPQEFIAGKYQGGGIPVEEKTFDELYPM